MVPRRPSPGNPHRSWCFRTIVSPLFGSSYPVRRREMGIGGEFDLFVRQWTWGQFLSSLPKVTEKCQQVDIVLSPLTAYAVDIMHSRSAESMGAAKFVFFPLFLLK